MMSDTLFKRIRHLLKDHIALLNKHSLGDTHVEQAENMQRNNKWWRISQMKY